MRMMLRQVPIARSLTTSRCQWLRARRCRNTFVRQQRHPPSRRLASVAPQTIAFTEQQEDGDKDPPDLLLDPQELFNGTIPYPKSLSPSSILEFQKCPQSFLFQYLYQLKQPTTPALAKGRMLHTALEQVFDLDPSNRTLVVLQNLFRSHWAKHRRTDTYHDLFLVDHNNNKDNNNNNNDAAAALPTTTSSLLVSEAEWGRQGLQLLQQYYEHEDPRQIVRPNPVQREVWVQAKLTVDPRHGVTAKTVAASSSSSSLPTKDWLEDEAAVASDDLINGGGGDENDIAINRFHVRGIVDRLDLVLEAKNAQKNNSPSEPPVLRLIDYKTGSAPNLKYSPSMNAKIKTEALEQLLIYALLWREQHAAKQTNSNAVSTVANQHKLDIRYLRLFYLTSSSPLPPQDQQQAPPTTASAQTMDYDLGATRAERDERLQQLHGKLANVWQTIGELVSHQDPKAFVGCTRSFCWCHTCRTKFVPGTVWEPSPEAKG